MNDTPKPIDRSALLSSALRKIEEMQVRLEAFERAKSEPIAIIGLSCRFPGGADNPEKYWRLLRDGVDAVSEVPADRWDMDAYYDPDPDALGKIYSRFGGFLRQIDKFDPQFFGISPREALSIDPQQRLVLEVGWEALENAGHAALSELRDSRTGVFVGVSTSDYGERQMAGGVESIDAYTGSGAGLSFSAGRLSYCLGLRGPSISVDTACSSSLVAIHLACQSLRAAECHMALAGGVNIMARPEGSVFLSRAKALAPDGRCKVFDAKANGFVRAEGCGIIVLKRFADAKADGDNVLAVIRGSAVNQDGASAGLTVPSGPAQQAVIGEALERSGIVPADVDYVETHGTGTSLGDPIEVGALAAALGIGRTADRALFLGSVKANIGHSETAAGVAGLIKVVLALQHAEIPPQIHYETLNPRISLGDVPVVIPTSPRGWPERANGRVAGVSAFGLSGTNAHVVLSEPPTVAAPVASADRETPPHIFTLSARSPEALWELAGAYAAHFQTHPHLAVGDICFTANTGRSQFAHRLAIVDTTTERMGARLAAFNGSGRDGVLTGWVEPSRRPRVAFLFTGQGAQYPGMGRVLYETQSTFRRSIDRTAELLRGEMNRPLLDALFPASGDMGLIDETAYAQPALFALEIALAELWRSWGIEPAILIGHSIGEYAAACVCGVLSVEDAAKLVATRGRLMQALPGGGAMVAMMGVDLETIQEAIAQNGDGQVSLAAHNAPGSWVLSGTERAVATVAATLAARGARMKRLTVSHAFHSALMDPVLGDFEEVARTVKYSAPKIPWISTLTGESVCGITDSSYWTRQIREPVRLADALSGLRARKIDLGVEIGPGGVLLGLARDCGIEEAGWVGSLRRDRDDRNEILMALGTLYTNGATVDWAGVERGPSRRRVSLPTYPFERKRYWSAPEPSAGVYAEVGSHGGTNHPLVHREIRSPAITNRVFEAEISVATHPFLADHRVFGEIVFPAAGYLEMVLAAARVVLGATAHALEDFVIYEAMTLSETGSRIVQVVIVLEADSQSEFKVFSRLGGAEPSEWTLHTGGRIRTPATTTSRPDAPSIEAARARCDRRIEVDAFYRKLRDRGIEFGASFRGVTELASGAMESVGRVTLENGLQREASRYKIHPALLDGALQALGAAVLGSEKEDEDAAYLPISIERFVLYDTAPKEFWSYATVREGASGEESITADIRLVDDNGRVIAEVQGFHARRATREALLRGRDSQTGDWLYEVAWRPAELSSSAADGCERSLLGAAEIGARVRGRIRAFENRYRLDEYKDLPAGLDAIAHSYVLSALRQLGWTIKRGDRISENLLVEKLGIAAGQRALFRRILQILEFQQIIRPYQDGWIVAKNPGHRDPVTIYEDLAARFPGFLAEMNLIDRCGRALADALRGNADPLQLLFPGGLMSEAEKMYQESPFARFYNDMAGHAVAAAIERFPKDRQLRVLEIGGGTGGTTSAILPMLRGRETEYVFTDIGPAFLTAAREKFREFSFAQYRTLDIEKEPQSQGFVAGSFDLVIAANVLHTTCDLASTMRHVQGLLKPRGLVILLEGTEAQDWVDLTFGLTPGWWKFSDRDLRPDHALLSAARWIELLAMVGYTAATSIPSAGTANVVSSKQAILIAEAPAESTSFAATGPWLILSDRSGVGQVLSSLLRDAGESSVMVTAGENYRVRGDGIEINPRQPAHFERLLMECRVPPRGVVHLWTLDTAMPAEDSTPVLEGKQQWACESALVALQAIARHGRDASVWLVTRGAQAVGEQKSIAMLQSPVWGLGKVAALEHPGLRCVRLDLDPRADATDASAIFAEMHNEGREDQIAYRKDARFVARLSPSVSAAVDKRKTAHRPTRFREDGAYLITGGFAGLGLLTAQWLVARGARYAILMGRSELAESGQRAIEELETKGARVRAIRVDVSDSEQVRRALADIPPDWPVLRGVIHSAGVLDDGILIEQTWARFATVMGPKITGAWNLHVLTRESPLDFFVLYSSAASLLGSPGQSNHAAANAFLDALAHYRRLEGRPGISINWGAWSEIGAAARRGVGARASMSGMGTITPEAGLAALERFLQDDIVNAGVLPVQDWTRLLRDYAGGSKPPFVSEIARRMHTAGSIAAAEKEPDLLARLQEVAASGRRRLVRAFVREQAVRILALDPSQHIDTGQSLNELGLDSLMALRLRNALGHGVNRTLPATVLFNYASIDALTEYICSEVLALEETTAITTPTELGRMPGLDQLADSEMAAVLAEKLRVLAASEGRADE